MQPATIKLFLVKGSPTGLRTAEISNWTGKGLAGSRSELEEFLKRDELQAPGVYLLTGIDSESGDPAVYVGEGENVSQRLRNQSREEDKDYWVHTTAFVSKDDNLTKAHVRYLEGKLIEIAQASKKAIVMNGGSSGSPLSEADIAEMDIFIDRILQLLPVLGIHLLTPSLNEQNAPQASSNNAISPIVTLNAKGISASGRRSENGFTVFKQSQATIDTVKSCPPAIIKHREKLLALGILIQEKDCYHFAEDYEFSSPSAAGTFVSGRSTNGLKAWADEKGHTLKELEHF